MKVTMSREEYILVGGIASRAVALLGVDKFNTVMDITICHEEACPLDLEGLLKAEDADFIHDVIGINRRLCHECHHLKDGFVPRFAKD